MERGREWTWAATALLLMISGCSGCHRDAWVPETSDPKGLSSLDLVEFQRQRALSLDSLMDQWSADWTGRIQTGTGIRLERLDSIPGATAIRELPEGSVLELHHRMSLLDGKPITDWQQDGPMAFEPGRTDLPSGFHELIGTAHLGDSIRAILPPVRAWGMSGLPPDIPQEAVIYFEFRVDLYRRPA